jgi:hypothetical protein
MELTNAKAQQHEIYNNVFATQLALWPTAYPSVEGLQRTEVIDDDAIKS